LSLSEADSNCGLKGVLKIALKQVVQTKCSKR